LRHLPEPPFLLPLLDEAGRPAVGLFNAIGKNRSGVLAGRVNDLDPVLTACDAVEEIKGR
jgi:hypothetical protein